MHDLVHRGGIRADGKRMIFPRAHFAVGALSVALAGCSLCSSSSVPCPAVAPPTLVASPLLAGVATVDVTPTGAPPLAGYGGAPRREMNASDAALAVLALSGICLDPDPSDAATFFEPSIGTHDPIRARALVLANSTHKLAIVKLDTIGVSRKLRDDLHAIAHPLGITNEQFVVLGTHTHSGPGAVADMPLVEVLGTDCFSDAIYEQILQGAAAALTQANASLQPAALGIGVTTETTASRNRRGRPGVYDTEIGLVKVETAAGTPLAALFNFAVHGTSLGPDNMGLSADCPGAMENFVEAGVPGVVALFTNGAEGDVAPEHVGWDGMELEGEIVGGDVVSLWPGITTKPSVVLAGGLIDVAMPPPRFNTGKGCALLAETDQSVCAALGLPLTVPLSSSWLPTTLLFQALRIDDSVFVAIPGEPITEIGWAIKADARAQGFARGFVLGLSNDYGGYFTTLAEYERGEYEGRSTMYGPTTGEIVVDSAKCVIGRVL